MIIHTYWDGPSSDLDEWIERVVRSLHPKAEINLWGPGDWYVNPYQVCEEDRLRHASNVSRYRALNEFGGLWLDHDVIPLVNLFDSTDINWVAGMGNWREGCAMRFEPSHPFLVDLIKRIDQTPSSDNRSVDVSGAGLLNSIHSNVKVEPRILPFDSVGKRIKVGSPIAVHLWATSFQRFNSERNGQNGRIV